VTDVNGTPVRRLRSLALAVAVAVVGLLPAAPARPAEASHTNFSPEFAWGWNNIVAWTFWTGSWAAYRTDNNGFQENQPYQQPIKERAEAAMNDWYLSGIAEGGKGGFFEVTHNFEDILFNNLDCGSPDTGAGAFIPGEQWWFANENALYTGQKSRICLNAAFMRYTVEGAEEVLAHELGHWLGLADKYAHNPDGTPTGGAGPAGAPHSIMDSAQGIVRSSGFPDFDPDPRGVIVGNVDPISGPTASDVANGRAFWRGWEFATPGNPTWNGSLVNWLLHAPQGGGYGFRASWDMGAWSANTYVLDVFRVNPNGSWSQVQHHQTNWRVGRHYRTHGSDRPYFDVDLSAHGPGVYAVCAVPIFAGLSHTGGQGSWTCSSTLTLV
jgi:hypothetical protein